MCNSPIIEIKISDINISCILDTGSMVSTISESFFNKFLKSKFELHPDQSWLKLRAANGLDIPYIGYIETDVVVPSSGKTVKDRGILIVKDTPGERRKDFPGLIGMNIISECMDMLQTNCVNTDVKGFARIAGNSEICVPANSVSIINVVGPTQKTSNDKTVLIEPISKAGDIMLVDSISTTEKNKYPVRVANLKSTDMWLKPNSRIGIIREVECVYSQNTDIEFFRTNENEETLVLKSEVQGTNEKQSQFDFINELNCSENEKRKIKDLIQKHSDVFTSNDLELGYCTTMKHKINLTDDNPISQSYRRIPPSQYEEVKTHIKDLLSKRIIKESTSPYSAPIVIVRKKDQSIRLCVDYRKLNLKTVRDAFPLPRIDESLDALHGAKYFTTLDLAHGFHQIAMDKADQHKTAFSTPFGLYEYTRMPMGLCNSPATFQRLMQNIFNESVFQMLLIYLDDLIVFSKTVDEHLQRLDKVFTVLKEHGLKLKAKKCHFFKEQVKYLGYIISSDGIATDPDKVDVVKKWPRPETVKDLRSFLGFSSYYRRFVPQFANIARPLYHLISLANKEKNSQKSNKLLRESWDENCTEAFELLKDRLTTSPVLGYADYKNDFILETDASLKGLGAVLMQKQDNKLRVIAYASRTLRPAERNDANYSSAKLELLAVKWAVTEKFKDYLLGSKFEIITDNNPLSYLQTSAKLGATEQRWQAQLAQFNFTITYRSGKLNRAADALSRITTELPSDLRVEACKITVEKFETEDGNPDSKVLYCDSVFALPKFTQDDLRQMQASDKIVGEFMKFFKTGQKPIRKEREHMHPKSIAM